MSYYELVVILIYDENLILKSRMKFMENEYGKLECEEILKGGIFTPIVV